MDPRAVGARAALSRRGAIPVAVLLGLLLHAPCAEAGGESACVREVIKGRGAEIVCDMPVAMRPEETEELKRVTREVFQGAECRVSVRIARSLVEAAMTPVACTVRTRESVIPVTFTVAPRIVIRAGVAVEAAPGMADVKGVPGMLSWPVVQLVNRWPAVQTGMLDAINAYLRHYGRARPQKS